MQYEVGDVVKLNGDVFKNGGILQRCARTGHLFVILAKQDDNYIASIISSQSSKVTNRFPHNVGLKDATEAGLKKSNTHVKVDERTIPFNGSAILCKVGHISDKDTINLLKHYSDVAQNEVIKLEKLKLTNENIELFNLLCIGGENK